MQLACGPSGDDRVATKHRRGARIGHKRLELLEGGGRDGLSRIHECVLDRQQLGATRLDNQVRNCSGASHSEWGNWDADPLRRALSSSCCSDSAQARRRRRPASLPINPAGAGARWRPVMLPSTCCMAASMGLLRRRQVHRRPDFPAHQMSTLPTSSTITARLRPSSSRRRHVGRLGECWPERGKGGMRYKVGAEQLELVPAMAHRPGGVYRAPRTAPVGPTHAVDALLAVAACGIPAPQLQVLDQDWETAFVEKCPGCFTAVLARGDG